MVRSDAEEEDVKYISDKQSNMVWHKNVGGCSSWVCPAEARKLMAVLRF